MLSLCAQDASGCRGHSLAKVFIASQAPARLCYGKIRRLSPEPGPIHCRANEVPAGRPGRPSARTCRTPRAGAGVQTPVTLPVVASSAANMGFGLVLLLVRDFRVSDALVALSARGARRAAREQGAGSREQGAGSREQGAGAGRRSRLRTVRRSSFPPRNRRELGERLTLAQVCQDQQGLPPRVQLPPARPGRRPVTADDPGHRAEGPGRQRQRGTVESMEAPRGGEADLADRLTNQRLLWSQQRHAAQ